MASATARGRVAILQRHLAAQGTSGDAVNEPKSRYAAQRLTLLTGNAHPELAQQVATALGADLCPARVSQFKNGETSVELLRSVRDNDCFVIQPTCNPRPNDYLVELLLLLDALRRAGAARITAIIPFYGYARQDKMDRLRVPISAKLITDCVASAGCDRILTLDLHASQVQGMTNIPMDNVYGLPLIAGHIMERLAAQGEDTGGIVVVSPDAGGAKRAELLAKELGCAIAIFSKQREKANEVSSMVLVGDVRGKLCVLVDDMVDTAGTLSLAAEQLEKSGARRVIAAATHGVFSPPAVERIAASPIEELAVLDTIPFSDEVRACAKIRPISSASLIAGSIHTLHFGGSVSELYAETLEAAKSKFMKRDGRYTV
eukprot:g7054.t1